MTNYYSQLIISAFVFAVAVVMVIVQVVLFKRSERKLEIERRNKILKEEQLSLYKQRKILGSDIIGVE